MIISASRRTDIPAFYFEWFCRRLQEGFVDVANPFNRRQVSRISLRREDVDCIAFWTKNPAPMLGRLDALKAYSYYVQVSITPYGKDIEPNLPCKDDIIHSARKLSERIGKERVVWRYDPILLNEKYTVRAHLDRFEALLEKLSPRVGRCVISFVDLYAKTKKNTEGLHLRELSNDETEEIAQGLSRRAKGSGLVLQTCAETAALEPYGIVHGACIGGELIERITGKSAAAGKAKSQRPLCKCVESFDIGQYNTCLHGCRYCYANESMERARRGFAAHDPTATVMSGRLMGDEHITLHGGTSLPR